MPFWIHVGPDGCRHLVVLERRREDVGRALIAGELRRAGIGHDGHGLGVDHRRQRCQEHVRPDVADQEVDVVGLDQLLGLLQSDVRLDLVVFVDDFDRQAAELAADMIEAELERVAHIVADHGDRAAKARNEADFDRLLLRYRRHRERARARAVPKSNGLIIACILLIVPPDARDSSRWNGPKRHL